MRGVLVIGCGRIGSMAAERWLRRGIPVWGLRRRTAGLPHGVRPVRADLSTRGWTRRLPPIPDTVVFSPAVGGTDREAYERVFVSGVTELLAHLGALRVRPRLLMISTTGVYGEGDGSWVDERTPPNPSTPAARAMLQAERLVQAAPLDSVLVRSSGIYGPGRDRLVRIVRNREPQARAAEACWVNQVFSEDLAEAVCFLAGHPRPPELVVATDSEPVRRRDVLNWIARRLHADPPPVSAERPPTPRQLSRKRCSNRRLLAAGFRFRHPTYRQGLARILPPEPAGPNRDASPNRMLQTFR